MALGPWYPMGGMFKIIEAMLTVAEKYGVKFEFNSAVQQIGNERSARFGVYVAYVYYLALFKKIRNTGNEPTHTNTKPS